MRGYCRKKRRYCGSYIVLQQKLKVLISGRRQQLREGKLGLIEHNMLRDDDTIGGEIKTVVSLMMSRVSQKDTTGVARGKFMWRYS